MNTEGLNFMLKDSCDVIAENKRFYLHNHPNAYEILLFKKGDSEFRVEGSVYPLSPGDLIIVSNYEMHRVYHNSSSEYARTVINVEPTFFTKHNCEQYKSIFLDRTIGENNCIPSELSHSLGLDKLIQKIEDYLNDTYDNGVAATAAFTEFLYLLNRTAANPHKPVKTNEQIKNIILYINERLTGQLSLDEIADAFYISKGHLCRIFKEHTGYTLNHYITYKRLMYVRELVASGTSWTNAGIEAGFSNYSNFYKAYCRTYGSAPRKSFKTAEKHNLS